MEGNTSKSKVVDLVWEGSEDKVGQEWMLVGKLLTKRNFNRGALEELVRRAWGTKGKVEINGSGNNQFIFAFQLKSDFDRVLRDSPWTVSGHILNLQVWKYNKMTKETDMSKCNFWVQVHQIPWGAQSNQNIMRLGAQIGDVVCFEDSKLNETSFREFVRIRVNVDLTKPLVAGFWIPRPGLEEIWANVCYEKLQVFCVTCGMIGHDQNTCEKDPVMADYDISKPLYSGDLCARPMKTAAAIVHMHGGPEGSVEIELARETSSSR